MPPNYKYALIFFYESFYVNRLSENNCILLLFLYFRTIFCKTVLHYKANDTLLPFKGKNTKKLKNIYILTYLSTFNIFKCIFDVKKHND